MTQRFSGSHPRVRPAWISALLLITLLAAGMVVVPPGLARAATVYNEVTGGVTHSWSNFTNAGGTAGPVYGAGSVVSVDCVEPSGFRVSDGNTNWYHIAGTGFYASADAFYNNGQTSGGLQGTPFVDPAVPSCASLPRGLNETVGGLTHTWTNPASAGGSEGPTIAAGQTVTVTCKLTGFKVADGNTWWYRIESSPWNGGFYASADAFYNNGQVSGSLVGTPWVDASVPDCAGTGTGGSGTKPAPSVNFSQGPAGPVGYRYAISLVNFAASTSVSITCYDSVSAAGFYTFSLTTNASGSATTSAYCYSADGPDHWVTAGGVTSNHVAWGSGSGTSPTPPAQQTVWGGGDTHQGPFPAAPTAVLADFVTSSPAPYVYAGLKNPGVQYHWWGNCYVEDIKTSNYGWVIRQTKPISNVFVRNGMLFGWFDQAGAPGALGCPTSVEYDWTYRDVQGNGATFSWAIQYFQGGALYWRTGMDHAQRIAINKAKAIQWASNCGAKSNCVYQGPDAPGGAPNYYNFCWAFVHNSYGTGANGAYLQGTDLYATAASVASTLGVNNGSTTPSPGAMMFWNGTQGNGSGHAVLSLGNGYALSTHWDKSKGISVIYVPSYAGDGTGYLGVYDR